MKKTNGIDHQAIKKGSMVIPCLITILLAGLTGWISISLWKKIPSLMKAKSSMEEQANDLQEKIRNWQGDMVKKKESLQQEALYLANQENEGRENRVKLKVQKDAVEAEKAQKFANQNAEEGKRSGHEKAVEKEKENLFTVAGIKIQTLEGPPRRYDPENSSWDIVIEIIKPWPNQPDELIPVYGPIIRLSRDIKRTKAWLQAKAVCEAANAFEKLESVKNALGVVQKIEKNLAGLNERISAVEKRIKELREKIVQVSMQLASLGEDKTIDKYQQEYEQVKRMIANQGYVSTTLFLIEIPSLFATICFLAISVIRLFLIAGTFKSKSLSGA